MGDGVYYSELTERSHRRSLQRRKKALVALLGLAAVTGGGFYGVTTWVAASRSITTITDALGPAAASSATARPQASPTTTKKPKKTPAPGPAPANLSGDRQQYRPSPTPTSTLTDDQIAAVQVGHLLERPATASSANPATVTDETAADGSLIRVVSARHDLSRQWGSLWAADAGRQVGKARCTQNFKINGTSYVEVRPALLLCWRTSAAKSVVTVATSRAGRPSTAASVAVVDREWSRIGRTT